MKTKPKPKSNGRVRSWLCGAFTAAALMSFAVNYCVITGRVSMQGSQEPRYQEADYIAASEALKPVKLTKTR